MEYALQSVIIVIFPPKVKGVLSQVTAFSLSAILQICLQLAIRQSTHIGHLVYATITFNIKLNENSFLDLSKHGFKEKNKNRLPTYTLAWIFQFSAFHHRYVQKGSHCNVEYEMDLRDR